MTSIEMNLLLLGIITIVSIIFRNFLVPTSLFLVITGMALSFLPQFPHIELKPKVVLEFFLPLLLYDASAFASSWRDFRANFRMITLLSIGHVIFITVLVAVVIHTLFPDFGWPLAIILGSVISPPDDVAIMAIADKINMPNSILATLKGEAILNDTTALLIFRFAVVALLTHQFAVMKAVSTFFLIIVCETAYGIVLAFIIGEARLRIRDPILQMMISILTPFLAYIPAEKLGGSGVLATVVVGLVLGQRYWEQYTPDTRLNSHAVWATLGFAVQGFLFLITGLNLRNVLQNVSALSSTTLITYSSLIIAIVIIGRFVWVYGCVYLPRLFSRDQKPLTPWQYPFVISWAGMRGGISLAAALAVPLLPGTVFGVNPRELLVFLVFAVIIVTLLVQGLSLPWILRWLGMVKAGESEKQQDRLMELQARLAMSRAALNWLKDYKELAQYNDKLQEQLNFHMQEYVILKKQLKERIAHEEQDVDTSDLTVSKGEVSLLLQTIEIERNELLEYWRQNKINFTVKLRLEEQLDLRYKQLSGFLTPS
jgi:monovalent cation/hydrogen antiporter